MENIIPRALWTQYSLHEKSILYSFNGNTYQFDQFDELESFFRRFPAVFFSTRALRKRYRGRNCRQFIIAQ